MIMYALAAGAGFLLGFFAAALLAAGKRGDDPSSLPAGVHALKVVHDVEEGVWLTYDDVERPLR